MPPVFGDYTCIDEGPYEFDDVCVEENDVVLDLGANLGLFSAYAASRGGFVYGFEPNARTIGQLKKVAGLYNGKIRIIPKALSDMSGTAEMTDIDFFGMNSLLIRRAGQKTTCVETVTIDEFVEGSHLGRVNFIKADIEGAERQMLRGAQNTLKQFAPKLALCTYHLADDPRVLERLIKDTNPHYKIIHKYKKLVAYV